MLDPNWKLASTLDPWRVFDYEVDMFEKTLGLCRCDALKSFDHPIPNAVLESLLLHTRILCDILLSRGRDPDDIKLKGLLPGFASSEIKKLELAYGKSDMKDTPCRHLNKRLAHASIVRSAADYFDHSPWLSQFLPVLLGTLIEVQQKRYGFPKTPSAGG